jgi:hypothetical protein
MTADKKLARLQPASKVRVLMTWRSFRDQHARNPDPHNPKWISLDVAVAARRRMPLATDKEFALALELYSAELDARYPK